MNARSSVSKCWSTDQYQLIDFGGGRKLERFGELTLDRPCPAANHARRTREDDWRNAHLRLDDQSPISTVSERQRQLADPWRVHYQDVVFDLRITPFGHVGLFPEHASQWNWLLERKAGPFVNPPRILNLFAYTGGATLVMASHGWYVTHVDASAPTVQWARHNAQLSNMQSAAVRWLVEDARVYVAREGKRQQRYDCILLDPPSYGHGPNGKSWQIEHDLMPLVEQCCQLLTQGGCIVVTGHSDPAPMDQDGLIRLLGNSGHRHVNVETGRVTLSDLAGRTLDFGWCLRAAIA